MTSAPPRPTPNSASPLTRTAPHLSAAWHPSFSLKPCADRSCSSLYNLPAIGCCAGASVDVASSLALPSATWRSEVDASSAGRSCRSSINLAEPKSVSLRWPRSSSSMFSGLKSLHSRYCLPEQLAPLFAALTAQQGTQQQVF